MGQPHLPAGLTEIPGRSSSGAHPVTLQSPGYIPTRAESVTPMYLAPETYLSERNSSVTWSNTSIDPVYSTATHTAASTTPFMHPYYDFGPAQPSMSMPQQFQASGYTPQEIDKWCMDSGLIRGLYQPTSIPQSRPLSYPAGIQPQNAIYPALSDIHDVDTHYETSEWLPQPIYNAGVPCLRSTQSQEFYLSPSYPTTATSTSSVMSTSPAPTTFSDFESSLSSVGTRQDSPSSNRTDLSRYGIPTGDGAWRCAHPGCTSQSLFRRGCDLRKHFNRHRKHLFCRHENCPQSRQGGFSSKKDRARHEAKHNPGIVCDWDGCGRVFSRVDNMKDHVRRIHRRVSS
ncbi:hypothetical protein N7495_004976 [Penicillium taxi]|uniref:uncharacterized protein n=1 Tax=Penicillium taxi TaxID=168475 RepID=UPI00254580E5|nr:uncharacterized protein N7495_004976 [Penicillium taxi]KAJ5893285.1 hypothetical protein N7495_004976 [Penicillium taxi]